MVEETTPPQEGDEKQGSEHNGPEEAYASLGFLSRMLNAEEEEKRRLEEMWEAMKDGISEEE